MTDRCPEPTFEQFAAALCRLKAGEREVLLLAAGEGLSNEAIARRLGLSSRTAERLLARSLRKLERLLEPQRRA